MSYFDSKRHTPGGDVGSSLRRTTDGYAQRDYMHISFKHVPSGKFVKFKAFITAFNETYNSDWTSETVYGRVDPIYLFKNTTRQIGLNFKIPAESESEAFDNLGRVQELVQYLYPNYTTLTDPVTCIRDVNAQTISQSPMVRLKVFNLLHTQKTTVNRIGEQTGPGTTSKILQEGFSQPFKWREPDYGVLGVIQNLTVNHNLEGEDGSFHEGPGFVLPKMIDIAITFNPIHEHPIGWNENGEPLTKMFPYGIDLSDSPGIPEPSTPPPVDGAFAVTDVQGNYQASAPGDGANTPSTIEEAPAGQTAAAGNTGAAINQAMDGLGLDLKCAGERAARTIGLGPVEW